MLLDEIWNAIPEEIRWRKSFCVSSPGSPGRKLPEAEYEALSKFPFGEDEQSDSFSFVIATILEIPVAMASSFIAITLTLMEEDIFVLEAEFIGLHSTLDLEDITDFVWKMLALGPKKDPILHATLIKGDEKLKAAFGIRIESKELLLIEQIETDQNNPSIAFAFKCSLPSQYVEFSKTLIASSIFQTQRSIIVSINDGHLLTYLPARISNEASIKEQVKTYIALIYPYSMPIISIAHKESEGTNEKVTGAIAYVSAPGKSDLTVIKLQNGVPLNAKESIELMGKVNWRKIGINLIPIYPNTYLELHSVVLRPPGCHVFLFIDNSDVAPTATTRAVIEDLFYELKISAPYFFRHNYVQSKSSELWMSFHSIAKSLSRILPNYDQKSIFDTVFNASALFEAKYEEHIYSSLSQKKQNMCVLANTSVGKDA